MVPIYYFFFLENVPVSNMPSRNVIVLFIFILFLVVLEEEFAFEAT